MTKEEFKKKYNNTKVYVGKHSLAVYNVLNSVYELKTYDELNQYPFIFIKDYDALIGNNMIEFNDESFKEVSAEEIAGIKIQNYNVGDIIIFDEYPAVVKCVTADKLYIGIYSKTLDDKMKTMTLVIDPDQTYPSASIDQIDSFLKKLLS